MLKLLRNICIWMCSTSCLFGYVTHAVPLEYFDDHEFSYDMDTAQSKVKYDPRQLSQQLKDQHNYPQERAAPCYSASNRYTHGQRVAREDPCEVCLCVDGEIFCWWKKCGNPKRRKFKLEKSAKVGKSKTDQKTIEKKLHKEQQQHLRQKKKLEKKLRQQHWQQQQQHELQLQRTGARNKILTFPENLPSVLYYDYKTEDQHGFQHGNHEKQAASSTNGVAGGSVGGRHNNAHDSISGGSETIGSRESNNDEENNDDDGHDVDDAREDGDDASSAVGVVEPASTEMKFGAKFHSVAGVSKKISLQQTSTARITTPGAVAPVPPPSEPVPNEHIKDDRLSSNNQFISGHPVGDIEMLSIDITTSQRIPDAVIPQNHTTTSTQGEPAAFMRMQSQEVDHDGILRDGPGGETSDSDSGPLGKYPSLPYNRQSNEQQPQPQLMAGGGGVGVGGTSFHSSFNDFSSEFNASAGVDLDLIMGHHNAHDAPIILEADSIVNVSSSSSASASSLPSLSPKQELGGSDSTNANMSTSDRKDNSLLSTTTVTSTTVNQEQECIVMGASYKIGAILPQETGNCLQCICIEGATKDDTPRVTCSPHNCPPLVLPDLFDATGY